MAITFIRDFIKQSKIAAVASCATSKATSPINPPQEITSSSKESCGQPLTSAGSTSKKGSTTTKRYNHPKPQAPLISLDHPGRLRTKEVLALLGIKHSTLHKRVKNGGAPKPDGTDPRPYWNTATIKSFLAGEWTALNANGTSSI